MGLKKWEKKNQKSWKRVGVKKNVIKKFKKKWGKKSSKKLWKKKSGVKISWKKNQKS